MFDQKYHEYVAKEVENGMIGSEGFKILTDTINAMYPSDTVVDVEKAIKDKMEIVGLIPHNYPVSMLRQNIDGHPIWTITLSLAAIPGPLVSLSNSAAGRSVDRNCALMGAIVRIASLGILSNAPVAA